MFTFVPNFIKSAHNYQCFIVYMQIINDLRTKKEISKPDQRMTGSIVIDSVLHVSFELSIVIYYQTTYIL